MFFKDDISIIDTEVESPLNLPEPPIFSKDELQILYNGNVFIASQNLPKDKQIKVYTKTFGLQETSSPKKQEEEYFSNNYKLINLLKKDFIERVINGISGLDNGYNLSKELKDQLNSGLVERIEKQDSPLIKENSIQPYVGKGLIPKLEDDSIFNSEIKGYERVLILDKKIYDLMTFSEYVEKFENSFESSFYKKVQKDCESGTPEEISKLMSDNKEKVYREVLPRVRNKIWHSKRSFKLFLDGTYWIPQFREGIDDSCTLYQKMIERKIKIDAVKGGL